MGESQGDRLRLRADVRIGIVITARMDSERLPGKVLAEIAGKPLLGHLVERYARVGKVVVATSDDPSDDPIATWAERHLVPCFRGSKEDVTDRIWGAIKAWLSDCDFVMRGLGDCPFPETMFITRAAFVMDAMDADMFLWMLPPWVWPVYGAREFPIRTSLWEAMNQLATGDEREHPDLYLHRHRKDIKIAYHEPPPPDYFRPHRLEIDYPEDLEMLRRLVKEFDGRWPTLIEALDVLDANPKIALINANREERTGPYASYSQEDRDKWAQAQRGKPVVTWDNRIWRPKKNEKPIFCSVGTCLIGYYHGGWLRTKEGHAIKEGRLACPCGAGRFWRAKAIDLREGSRPV